MANSNSCEAMVMYQMIMVMLISAQLTAVIYGERLMRIILLYSTRLWLTSASTIYASAAALGRLTIGGGGAPADRNRRRSFLVGGGGIERRQ
jgi:hypothetical protein